MKSYHPSALKFLRVPVTVDTNTSSLEHDTSINIYLFLRVIHNKNQNYKLRSHINSQVTGYYKLIVIGHKLLPLASAKQSETLVLHITEILQLITHDEILCMAHILALLGDIQLRAFSAVNHT